MSRTLHRILIGASASLILVTLIGGHYFRDMQHALDQPFTLQAPVLFEIAPGQSITKIARDFADRGWLTHAIYLRIEATRRDLATRIQAGTYEILPGSTIRGLLQKFVAGDVKQYSVTIIEGTQFKELRKKLARLPGLQSAIEGLADDEVMRRIGAPDESPEGRFFPSTYFYPHHTKDIELLERAYRQLQTVLEESWAKRAEDLPYSTPYDALIMASIVEKETGVPAERQQIAGVFVRRLQQNMMLQTDPTVIYGLGDKFDGNLRRIDLQRDTPYNTYLRPGLPPTPISMPGEAAIQAALNPAPGAALYFVARGDGTHEFSATLSEHNAAVRRFQIKERVRAAR